MCPKHSTLKAKVDEDLPVSAWRALFSLRMYWRELKPTNSISRFLGFISFTSHKPFCTNGIKVLSSKGVSRVLPPEIVFLFHSRPCSVYRLEAISSRGKAAQTVLSLLWMFRFWPFLFYFTQIPLAAISLLIPAPTFPQLLRNLVLTSGNIKR